MAAAASEKTVTLVSQEGDSFSVAVEVAQMSELVKTMIDGEYPYISPYDSLACILRVRCI